MRRLNADCWLALVVFALAAGYLYLDSKIVGGAVGDPIGPRLFPAIIGCGLILSALMILIEGMRRSPAVTGGDASQGALNPLVLIGVVLWTAIYYLSLEWLGYLLATTVFLLPMLSYFNRDRYLANLLVATAFAGVVYGLFGYVLNSPMPVGEIFSQIGHG